MNGITVTKIIYHLQAFSYRSLKTFLFLSQWWWWMILFSIYLLTLKKILKTHLKISHLMQNRFYQEWSNTPFFTLGKHFLLLPSQFHVRVVIGNYWPVGNNYFPFSKIWIYTPKMTLKSKFKIVEKWDFFMVVKKL